MTIHTTRQALLFALLTLASSTVAPGSIAVAQPTPIGCDARTPIGALPYVITNAGSYYLRHNLVGVDNKHGIEVQADDVTIDLNGFLVQGTSAALDGIHVTGSHANLTVKNGELRLWASGVDASTARNAKLDHLQASANRLDGLSGGTECTMSDCSASQNSRYGLRIGSGSSIVGCTAASNGDHGIVSTLQSTITRCSARANIGSGFRSGDGDTLSMCTAESNGEHGISLNDRCRISDCVSNNNTGAGIRTQTYCYLNRNIANGNHDGVIAAGSYSRIEANHCSSNSTMGYKTESGVIGCLVVQNSACINGVNNYDVLPGNALGQIILNPSVGFVSDQPWANFSFTL